MMMFALALPVLTCSIGMGVDYARAAKAQSKLNAIADAAALLAVSKNAMRADDATAAYFARSFFSLQSAALVKSDGITLSNVTVQAPTDGNGRRTAVVNYRATSANVFARILGMSTLTISGKSETANAIAPDIDFYMLLDVSASMALPTTSSGLNKVAQSNTSRCVFACHTGEKRFRGYDAHGKQTDLYGVALSYGLPLRIDAEGDAVNQLTATARSMASKNGSDYRIAITTFRGARGFSVRQPLTNDLTAAGHKAANLKPPYYASIGCPTSACKSSEVGWNDRDTGSSDAMDQINAMIPQPGSGVNGQDPQAVVFMVTDGMRNEKSPKGARPEVAFDTAKCDMIKHRGIRIAVLYTEYLRDAVKGTTNLERSVEPYLYQIEPALQSCASPGLYTKVTTDGDISAALNTLFQNAVATTRITK